MKTKCLFPECKSNVRSRGLCLNHYASAQMLVKRGYATWKKLENTGRAKLARAYQKGVRDWFLNGGKA